MRTRLGGMLEPLAIAAHPEVGRLGSHNQVAALAVQPSSLLVCRRGVVLDGAAANRIAEELVALAMLQTIFLPLLLRLTPVAVQEMCLGLCASLP